MRISDWSSDVCSSDLSKVQLSLASSGMFGDTWQLPLNNPFLPDAVRSEVCASNAISAADCAAAGTATSPNDPAYREVATVINRRFIEAGPRIRNLTTNQLQVWTGAIGRASGRERVCQYVKT